MSRDKTIFEEATITKDESGQVVKETARRLVKTEAEDDYIKVYVKFLGVITNLPTTANPLLNSLLRRMGYASLNKQAVILNPTEIEKISAEAKMSKGHFYKQMRILIQYGIIFSESTAKTKNIKTGKINFCDTFYFNSMLFGRGSWKDIKEIRASITLNTECLQLVTETSEEATTKNCMPLPTGQQTLFEIDWDKFNETETKIKALPEN